MISISVKFAPPTVMFLSPPPLAPAAALEVELEELEENAFDGAPAGREQQAHGAGRREDPDGAEAPARARGGGGVRCCRHVRSPSVSRAAHACPAGS